jgi:hypothetical protein
MGPSPSQPTSISSTPRLPSSMPTSAAEPLRPLPARLTTALEVFKYLSRPPQVSHNRPFMRHSHNAASGQYVRTRACLKSRLRSDTQKFSGKRFLRRPWFRFIAQDGVAARRWSGGPLARIFHGHDRLGGRRGLCPARARDWHVGVTVRPKSLGWAPVPRSGLPAVGGTGVRASAGRGPGGQMGEGGECVQRQCGERGGRGQVQQPAAAGAGVSGGDRQ